MRDLSVSNKSPKNVFWRSKTSEKNLAICSLPTRFARGWIVTFIMKPPFLNLPVLCGWLRDEIFNKTSVEDTRKWKMRRIKALHCQWKGCSFVNVNIKIKCSNYMLQSRNAINQCSIYLKDKWIIIVLESLEESPVFFELITTIKSWGLSFKDIGM